MGARLANVQVVLEGTLTAQHGVAPLGKVPLVDHRHEGPLGLEIDLVEGPFAKALTNAQASSCARLLFVAVVECRRSERVGFVTPPQKRPNVQAASVLLLAQVGNVNVVPPQGAPASHMCVISKTGSQGSSRVCECGQRIHCPRQFPTAVLEGQPIVMLDVVVAPGMVQFKVKTVVGFLVAVAGVLGVRHPQVPPLNLEGTIHARLQPAVARGAHHRLKAGQFRIGRTVNHQRSSVSTTKRGGRRARNELHASRPSRVEPFDGAGAVRLSQHEAAHEQHGVPHRKWRAQGRSPHIDPATSTHASGFHQHARQGIQGVGHIRTAKSIGQHRVCRPSRGGDLFWRQQRAVGRDGRRIEGHPIPHQ